MQLEAFLNPGWEAFLHPDDQSQPFLSQINIDKQGSDAAVARA